MKRIRVVALILSVCITMLLSLSMTSAAVAQDYPAVSHDTWSSGTPMPKATILPAAAVLGKRIVLVGGGISDGTSIADTYIYNPAANTWSKGVPLPTPTNSPAAAVVNNVLYVIGGEDDTFSTGTNAVWAFDLQTKTWSPKSPMPTARGQAAAVVEKNNIIYVIGGAIGYTRFNSVESYNPATDIWTEETPLLVAESDVTAGLIGTWIVVADGYNYYGGTGDNEGYNPFTKAWKSGAPDPTPRSAGCGGSIGTQLYVAGGYPGGSWAYTLTESFNGSNNIWTRLADMPQRTVLSASAVYNGQLYCFGGVDGWGVSGVTYLNNVQIYQP
jgi:N-acetylneuraminic acid mutarotase